LGLLVFGLLITLFAADTFEAQVDAVAQREFDFICNEIQLDNPDRLAASAQVLYGSTVDEIIRAADTA